MARFKFVGEAETIFHDLIHAGDEEHAEGSTVEAQPGEEFDVKQVKNPAAVLHPELEAVDDEAKKIVAAAQEQARIEGSRVFGDTSPETEVVEGASALVPADDTKTAPADPPKTDTPPADPPKADAKTEAPPAS